MTDFAWVIKWPGSSMMRVEVYEVVKWTDSMVQVRERSGTTRMKLRTDHHEVYRGPEEVKARIRAIRDSRINYLATELAKWQALLDVELRRVHGEIQDGSKERLGL
jgi:hypothetical protein